MRRSKRRLLDASRGMTASSAAPSIAEVPKGQTGSDGAAPSAGHSRADSNESRVCGAGSGGPPTQHLSKDHGTNGGPPLKPDPFGGPHRGLIREIRASHRLREDFLSAEKKLTLQIKAICRRTTWDDERSKKKNLEDAHALYEALVNTLDHPDAKVAGEGALPLLSARALVEAHSAEVTKRLERLARQLPVWPAWAITTKGLGALGLAQIVGECGDLSAYPTKEKLWKRMGVHVADGSAPRPKAGEQTDWSPRRRSVLWNIGESIKKLSKKSGGHYREVYDARKVRELEKAAAEGLIVLPSADVEKRVKRGEARERFRSLGHIDRRARRYAEKKLLRDLWMAWRDGVMTSCA